MDLKGRVSVFSIAFKGLLAATGSPEKAVLAAVMRLAFQASQRPPRLFVPDVGGPGVPFAGFYVVARAPAAFLVQDTEIVHRRRRAELSRLPVPQPRFVIIARPAEPIRIELAEMRHGERNAMIGGLHE